VTALAGSTRVVSLLPSATEIVCALGFEGNLVGRSHECDFPRSVLTVPSLTEPKFPLDGSSFEIDRHVKKALTESHSLYHIHADGIALVRPDVILTQRQCEVCAVSERDVEEALADLIGTHPRVLSLSPSDLDDIFVDIQTVSTVLGVPERGAALVSSLRARTDAIRVRAATAPSRPRVACIEWIEPLMAAGNWVPTLISTAGGENLIGQAGRHSPYMTFEMLQACNPEVVVVVPCGFDLSRTRAEISVLLNKPVWSNLPAVRSGQVYLADGNQFFNRPGPRIIDSLEILAEILHPDLFSFGHRGRGDFEPL
jgi:iron complex transport system substrate-binding protein